MTSVPWMTLKNHWRSWSCSLFKDQRSSRVGFLSLAGGYYSSGLLVLEKRCWQRLWPMKLEQASSMSQCPPSLQNGLVKMRRMFELCSHLRQRSPQLLFLWMRLIACLGSDLNLERIVVCERFRMNSWHIGMDYWQKLVNESSFLLQPTGHLTLMRRLSGGLTTGRFAYCVTLSIIFIVLLWSYGEGYIKDRWMCHHALSRQTNGICDEQNYGWSTICGEQRDDPEDSLG